MPRLKLTEALTSVDWNSHVVEFLADHPNCDKVANANLRLAIWSQQFENTDRDNPALSFIREMQVAAHYVPALLGLALYKPAASSMRIIFETSLYYTYFRSHPSELATLVRDKSYYLSKADIISYHKDHTVNFRVSEQKFGLLSRIENWYGDVSALIHGQIPGSWGGHTSLKELKHSSSVILQAIDRFCIGEEIVHNIFLCTVGRDLWDGFSSHAKSQLLKGVSGDKRKTLGFDEA